MRGRAPLSTSTQPISARRVTVQKSVNTRRNSTQRFFVLLCGVSSEVLGRVCGGKVAAGVAGSMLGRFRSCIAPPLPGGPGADHLRHSCDTAFLVEDGKQMTCNCKGFCASEQENVLIRHQTESAIIGRAKSCKCFTQLIILTLVLVAYDYTKP